MNGLDASVTVQRGAFTLEVDLHVDSGEVLALLGPNGSGKSTLLAALAGLLPLTSGLVTVAGRTLSQTGSPRIALPPEHRGVGLLGQEPLLFPHLTALDNVAFGARAHGTRRAEARQDARGWLAAVGLAGFADRKPAQLSGGQQQRVALARAFAAKPSVLLLDEPLAAVDVETASLLRQLLRERLTETGTTAVLVTHDVLDAIVMADRVAILHQGRIVDEGRKERVLGAPRNRFIAALAGVNLVTGTADSEGNVRTADGRRFRGRFSSAYRPQSGAPLAAVFRPSAVDVRISGAEAPAANHWEAVIAALEPSSGGVRVRLVDDPAVVADVSPLEVAERGLSVGARVWLTVAEDDVALHRQSAAPAVAATVS